MLEKLEGESLVNEDTDETELALRDICSYSQKRFLTVTWQIRQFFENINIPELPDNFEMFATSEIVVVYGFQFSVDVVEVVVSTTFSFQILSESKKIRQITMNAMNLILSLVLTIF